MADPRVTVIAVWVDAALYFCTGPTERRGPRSRRQPALRAYPRPGSLDEGIDL